MNQKIITKPCIQCGEHKALGRFYQYSKGKHGRRAACKTCCYARYGKLWRTKARQWGRDNPERNRARACAWTKADPGRVQAGVQRLKLWRRNNPERWAVVDQVQGRARTAKKMKAMPKWANPFFISEAYALARLRTKVTGIKWHVDHRVPLRSNVVCGLHVETNLQVIPASVNCRKSNKSWPDMPLAPLTS